MRTQTLWAAIITVALVLIGLESAAFAQGICGTGIGTQDQSYNDCLTAHCCASFTPCYNDGACLSCLEDPSGAACSTNALYGTYTTCAEGQCPLSICETGVTFTDGTATNFDCNRCAQDNCCPCAEGCTVGGSDPEVELCITCLGDPNAAGCTNPQVEQWARSLNACIAAECAAFDCTVGDGTMGDASCGSGSGGGGGAGGGGGSGPGSGGAITSGSASNGSGGNDGDDDDRGRRRTDSCDCATPGASANGHALWVLLALGLALRRRR